MRARPNSDLKLAATPEDATTPAPETSGSEDGSLTVGTTEGPYYVSGTDELEDGELNPTNLPGVPIRITGHVYGGGGTDKPLAGAKVEIWHTDTDGKYYPASNGPASQYSLDELKLRGYVVTDADGRCRFTSIYPGPYPGRTRHIHMRVAAEGYGALVTQIIVPAREGDPMTPADDTIARSLPDVHQVDFKPNGDVLDTTFDFHLGAD